MMGSEDPLIDLSESWDVIQLASTDSHDEFSPSLRSFPSSDSWTLPITPIQSSLTPEKEYSKQPIPSTSPIQQELGGHSKMQGILLNKPSEQFSDWETSTNSLNEFSPTLRSFSSFDSWPFPITSLQSSLTSEEEYSKQPNPSTSLKQQELFGLKGDSGRSRTLSVQGDINTLRQVSSSRSASVGAEGRFSNENASIHFPQSESALRSNSMLHPHIQSIPLHHTLSHGNILANSRAPAPKLGHSQTSPSLFGSSSSVPKLQNVLAPLRQGVVSSPEYPFQKPPTPTLVPVTPPAGTSPVKSANLTSSFDDFKGETEDFKVQQSHSGEMEESYYETLYDFSHFLDNTEYGSAKSTSPLDLLSTLSNDITDSTLNDGTHTTGDVLTKRDAKEETDDGDDHTWKPDALMDIMLNQVAAAPKAPDPEKVLDDLIAKLDNLNLTNDVLEVGEVSVGCGGQADVYKGRLRDGREVAVKRFRILIQSNIKVFKRISRELRICARVKHENVLPFLGFILEKSNRPSLVTPWIETGNLRKYLEVNPGPQDYGYGFALGITRGLAHLRSLNIVHGDLKSDNIMISSDGKPLLMDFGLSHLHECTSTYESATNAETGSLRYMAIELLQQEPEGEEEDFSNHVHTYCSDVWAFGMVVREILTGKQPYSEAPNFFTVYRRITEGHLPKRPKEYSQWSITFQVMWHMCEKCWTKTPNERPEIGQLFKLIESLRIII